VSLRVKSNSWQLTESMNTKCTSTLVNGWTFVTVKIVRAAAVLLYSVKSNKLPGSRRCRGWHEHESIRPSPSPSRPGFSAMSHASGLPLPSQSVSHSSGMNNWEILRARLEGDRAVAENLEAGAYIRSDRAAVHADIDHWFSVFPRLAERRSQQAGSLSGGEQQMLALARALMLRPKLLLLDEPSLGLAPIITQQLFQQLAELNKEDGTTMFIVEQNANLALSIAARAYVLEAGEIVLTGPSEELRHDDDVRRAYLGF